MKRREIVAYGMRRLVLFLLMLPWVTEAQEAAPWNPDANGDGCVTTSDLVSLLSVFNMCSDWGEVDCPDPLEFLCGDTVVYHGHEYGTVAVGGQCWFSENLRTSLYLNGDVIPSGLNDSTWAVTTEGATSVYGEGSSECDSESPDLDACDSETALAEYGRLYNWLAVDDPRGLCPAGWHVPSSAAWSELENHIGDLGFSGGEGAVLKSTTGWSDDGNGTDEVGFSTLPGGFCSNSDGGYSGAGISGSFWSSTANGDNALPFLLFGNFSTTMSFPNDPRCGFSVRCLQDD